MESHSALPCCLPAALPSCGRSYKKHSPSTIGDITQRRKELDSARCQGELQPPAFPQDGSPLGKGLVCACIPERRGLDSGRPPHALREKRLGGGRDLGGELHWRVFNGWGYGKRAGSGVEAGWTPSVCSERCDTSRRWGVGVQGLPGSLWVPSGAGSLPSSGI